MSKPFAFWVQLATVVSMSTVVSIKPFQPATPEWQRSMSSSTGPWHRLVGAVSPVPRPTLSPEQKRRLGESTERLEESWAAFLRRHPVGMGISDDGSSAISTASEPIQFAPIALATGSWVVGLDPGPVQLGFQEPLIAGADEWDLFRNPGLPGSQVPVFEDPMAQGRAETVDELFGGPAIAAVARNEQASDPESIHPPGRPVATRCEVAEETADGSSFAGAVMRTWSDNTGNFHVIARVSLIFGDRVRLVKENGRTTTVPLRRLSDADQQYLKWVAQAMAAQPSGNVAR